MARTLQLLTMLTTGMIAFFLGVIFDEGYWQTSIHAGETLEGRPLPTLTSLVAENHRMLLPLFVIPWIAFVAAPLFWNRGPEGDTEFFLLRFALFVAVESFLFLVLLVFLILPFVPSYALMETRGHTVMESALIAAFWIFVTVSVGALVRRWAGSQKRKTLAAKNSK